MAQIRAQFVEVVRLYFNRHGEKPWSVDFGPGTTEYQTERVVVNDVSGYSVYAPDAGDNKITPTAWIIFRRAAVMAEDSDVSIQIRPW
jgi:hypothetical protein